MKKVLTAGAALVLALALASPTAALADEVEAPVSAPLTTEQEAVVPEDQAPAPLPAAEVVAPEVSTLTNEPQGQPEFICDEDGEGWQSKVDWDGDGNPTVTAPEGFLIDSYCVKAGTVGVIRDVSPASASVEIDHPEKDSVSHYQVHLIPAPVEEDPDPVFVPCTSTESIHNTTLDGWDFSQSSTDRSASWDLAEDGLAVSTLATGHRKVAGYTGLTFPLSHYGTFDIDWTGTTPPPGGQMLVDLDGDGTPTGYLVIEDAYNGEWWLSANRGGDVDPAALPVSAVGGGGVDWTTPQAWLNAFPDAVVQAIGFSLGSGVTGEGTIHSITVGCTVFTFGLPPLPEDYTDEGAWVLETPATCDEPTETYVRESTSYTYTRNEDGSIKETTETWTDRDSYSLTDEEIAELCPVVPDPTCDEFAYQEDAQAAFDSDSETYASLDGDGDGIVCEVLPSKPVPPAPTPTPTTTASPSALAATGGTSPLPWVGAGILALLLGGVGVTVAATRRR